MCTGQAKWIDADASLFHIRFVYIAVASCAQVYIKWECLHLGVSCSNLFLGKGAQIYTGCFRRNSKYFRRW